MTRVQAYRMKNVSVYVGVLGYTVMMLTGNVLVGAWTKLIAEFLRIPYYRQTGASDMAGLSVFFITASLIAIVRSFF